MAGAAFPDITAALKEFYMGPLNDQVHKAYVMLDRLEKNSDDVSGEYAYVPLISARNPGVGSRTDATGSGPTLPTAGRQSYAAATFKMAYHYGRGQVSGPAIRATRNNAGAFAKIMDTEMKGLSDTLPEGLNRMLWSYGHGRCATLAASVATADTYFMANKFASFNGRVGDRVHAEDITDANDWDPASGAVITSIIFDSTTIAHQVSINTDTFDTLVSTAAAIYYGGGKALAAVDVSHGQEMYGIPAAIDDGAVAADEGLGLGVNAVAGEATEFLTGSTAFGGIIRSTSPYWQSTVLKGSTAGTPRQLTNSLLQQAWLTAIANGAASKRIEVYCNPGVWATWGLLHVGDRRFNDDAGTVEGGWEYLKFNGTKVFYDRDAPRYKIWFVDMSTLMLLTQGGYMFMEEDGSALERVSGVDAYEFTLFRDVQLGARNCNKNVLLGDVEQDVTINID